ncbi:MAG: GTPase HflX [Oscillospiraceae bacterium]|nr:GTPase HflX [Oscillospiraceae bacterium]
MNEFEKFAKTSERAVLVGLWARSLPDDEVSTDDTMDELEALLETAGGESAARIIQRRDTPDGHTFIGEGKCAEVKELAAMEQATLIVFDNDLTPSQTQALEQEIGLRVIDRSTLILDIFAQRARTREGRLQVELAQYKYVLPRLLGMWTHLERQEGAIGTRGPGETQLETDRRHIRRKISKLGEELEEVRRVRGIQRRQRIKNDIPVVALVGYTNAGKSTLMNTLTDAGIHANDRLFDTLDTTTRQFVIGPDLTVLLSDTVGFIRKLPHHLVEAFKATLEELCYADCILHVIDVSNPLHTEHERVTDQLIERLGASNVPQVRVYNKADLTDAVALPRGENVVCISALNGRNVDELKEKIRTALDRGRHSVTLLLPYSEGGVLDRLYREASVDGVDYTAEGIEVKLTCTTKVLQTVTKFIK